MKLPQQFFERRKIEDLVENRTTYTVAHAELNVYETHHFAEEVYLHFHQPVFASMIEGKKVMYLRDQDPFDFLPGQSVMMPANEVMKIDFPEAAQNNPTRCLAMTISQDKIDRIVEEMNYDLPKADSEWLTSKFNYTFANDAAVNQVINRLMFLFMENHPSKDLFVDMTLRELMIRVLQSENRNALGRSGNMSANASRLHFVIEYIKSHLDETLSITDLSKKACMSESNFYKVFRNETGQTPIEFINDERIRRAAFLLKRKDIKVKEVYLSCGFNNISYFVRTFKKVTGHTPKEFQQKQ